MRDATRRDAHSLTNVLSRRTGDGCEVRCDNLFCILIRVVSTNKHEKSNQIQNYFYAFVIHRLSESYFYSKKLFYSCWLLKATIKVEKIEPSNFLNKSFLHTDTDYLRILIKVN